MTSNQSLMETEVVTTSNSNTNNRGNHDRGKNPVQAKPVSEPPKAEPKGIPEELFYEQFSFLDRNLTREQKLHLVKLLIAPYGGQVDFPGNFQRKTLDKILGDEGNPPAKQNPKKNNGKIQPKAGRKPENQKMKGTPEETALHQAQKALKAKKLELGLPKSSKDDPRISVEVANVKQALLAYKAKKQQ